VAACGAPGLPATAPPSVADGGPIPIVDASIEPDGAPLPPPLQPMVGWLKGQLHLHSAMSGDSDTPPNDVVRFYQERGYDFIVFTDHNHITELPPRAGDMLILPGVELTHSTVDCDPPPEKKKCLVHMNALFVRTPPPAELPVAERTSNKRLALYERYIAATKALGGLAQLNHPNFGWTVDPALAAEIGKRGVKLIEVFNQGMPLSNPGDDRHVSSEMLWDTVLTLGVKMWGTATDDAHHYYDHEAAHAIELAEDQANGRDASVDNVYPADLGFVVVHAERDPTAIRQALERGDFYASTGVLLADVVLDEDGVTVAAAGVGPFSIDCIGEGGQRLATFTRREARCERPEGLSYVRARITDVAGKRAWTQPAFGK
jgi:hypothetical protein